jgi:hypothetical protein
MHTETDTLKKRMVECVRQESTIRDEQYKYRLELQYEKRWAEKCAPYDGQV